MALNNDLVLQFAKITKDDKNTSKESTVFGTIVEYEGDKYVQFDGSDLLTPMSSTTNIEAGERVTVMIKNHSAIVTGNLSSPAARTTEVEKIGTKISDFEIVLADKVDTEELNALQANITELEADNVTIHGELTANKADITDLKAENADITGKLTATDADIETLQADNVLIRNQLVANNASVENLQAEFAKVDEMVADKLSATDADLKYANIDFTNIGKAAMEYFYANSGLIEDVSVGDATISGNLVGVTISGDLIEGNTIVAEKLVVKGEDGLYYKLNTDGMQTVAEQTDYNSLNGSVIRAKSVTATQISVKDLVAFDATIGGFVIDENAIHSTVKESVDNTTRGIYMDNDGQLAIGDATNYIKFYEDTDGTYKLVISAATMTLGGSSKTVEDAIVELENSSVNVDVGARNLLRCTDISKYSGEWTAWANGSLMVSDDSYLKVTPGDGDTSAGAYPPKNSNLSADTEYTLSFEAYADSDVTFNYCYIMDNNGNHSLGFSIPISTTPTTYTHTFTTTKDFDECSVMLGYRDANGTTISFYIRHLQVEKGNLATDWTPAPEDISDAINAAQSMADSNAIQINDAQLDIDSINATISSLVTGQNGESLMTQTDTGWTFSMSNVFNTLESAMSDIDGLNTNIDTVNSMIDALNKNVADLGVYTEYIKFGVENGKPCIILGETDSDFKVVITNTDIRFMEGTTTPASITNQALNIGKAVVTEELRQGDFAWVARSNGNYGLVWKGA